MAEAPNIDQYKYQQNREITVARTGDELLGPFALLPGTWRGQGRGWNMIALPFVRTRRDRSTSGYCSTSSTRH